MNRYLNIERPRACWRRPKWDGPSWFNLGIGSVSIGVLIPGRFYRSVPVWPYNAFRRVYADPRNNCWGFGVLQVSGRHLLGVVSNEEKFQIDVAFAHVVHIARKAGA